jgi:hypothetical protein
LYRLPSLKQLQIWGPHKIRSLPKEGLPDSLRKLSILNCGPEIYEECQKLSGMRPDIDTSARRSWLMTRKAEPLPPCFYMPSTAHWSACLCFKSSPHINLQVSSKLLLTMIPLTMQIELWFST